MTSKELRRLRQFYHSLRSQFPIFEDYRGNIDHYPVTILERDMAELQEEFPNLVPPFQLPRVLRRLPRARELLQRSRHSRLLSLGPGAPPSRD
jgi:hypothetical protein